MSLPKLSLLIVENNHFLVTVLNRTLSREFDVTIAANGFEAMALLEKGLPIDFVVTDLKLPRFDGLELIQRIRSSKPYQSMPILALSDGDDSDARISSLEVGADDCMSKPFNPLEVQAKIRAMLRRAGGPNPRNIRSLKALFPGLQSLGLN
ncbi:hypothetical protein GCM10027299_57780 [Larkinella ripae]